MAKPLRILAMLPLFFLLFTACGQDPAGEEKFLALKDQQLSAQVQARLQSGGKESEYTLHLSLSGQDAHITVAEPAAHAGIAVTVGKEGSFLRYGQTELVIPGGEEKLSLFSLLWSAAAGLTGGRYDAAGAEDENFTVYCSAKLGDAGLTHRYVLDGETGLPLISETAGEGVSLYLRWESCEISEG